MRTDNFHWPWPDMPVETLLQRAHSAALKAYVPYSDFAVGAALLTADGSLILGCNVENASYGLSLCAERNVIGTMVALGRSDPVAIAVVGGNSGAPCPPCGACRQVLTEFNPDMFVVLESPNKALIMRVSDLFPLSFAMPEKPGKNAC